MPNASQSTRLDHADNGSIVTQEQFNSVQELINVDHLYSKPVQDCKTSTSKLPKPSFKIQLSSAVPSTKLIKQPSSPLIKVDLTVKRKNKSTALLEDNFAQKRNQTVQRYTKDKKLAQASSKNQSQSAENNVHPMLCDVKLENDSVTNNLAAVDTPNFFISDFDAELDSLLNDQCHKTDPPLLSPLFFEKTPTQTSDSESVSSASPQSIDTPLISDILDPFDNDYHNTSFLNDSFSAELFPQLAAVI